ncbi:uncharacterized protein LOC135494674 [Lineus longissimus]|uniref:uncharacterized protein LOC135494674 n=1 Tax=Lineus longissimus TaxID=88925 RepID=UPI00315DF7AE
MEGVPGLPPAGSTQSMEGNSKEQLDKLEEISSTLEEIEESLQQKHLKLLSPGIPLSRKAALHMDIDRTEAQVKELRHRKTQIEVDLGIKVPKEEAGVSSDGTIQSRPASAGPSSGMAGLSPGFIKDEEAGGGNQGKNKMRRRSASPTFGMASPSCSVPLPKEPWPNHPQEKPVLQKSALFAILGSGSDQNKPRPAKKGPHRSASFDSHELSPLGPSQVDSAQCSIETHRNQDHQSSAQTSPFCVPESCHNTHPLNESLNCIQTSTDSENVHSSQAISMIPDGYASTSASSSDSSFVDGSNAPCSKPVPSGSRPRQDEVSTNVASVSHAPLRQSSHDCLLPNSNTDTSSTKALNDIELILKRFTMGLSIRRELSEKINEIRAGFVQMSGAVVESSKPSYQATSGTSSLDCRSKTMVRSVSDDSLQTSTRGDPRQSRENTLQVETLLSRIKALENEVRFQTDGNLKQRVKLKQAEDSSRVYKTVLESRKHPGWEGQNKLEALVRELHTEKGQVSELVNELETQLQFQANAHVDVFNKLKQTEAELHNHKTMMDFHKVQDAKEQDQLKELIRSLREEKEASEVLVKDLRGQLNDERMVRENAEKSVRDCQENLDAKQRRLDLLQADFDSRLTLVSEKAEVTLNVAQSELKRSEAQVEKLVASADAWNKKTEDLVRAAKSDLQESEAEVKTLKQKLVEFDKVKLEKDEVEECARDLRLMFETEEKKTKELSNEKIELESKMRHLKEVCNSLKSDCSSMRQQLCDLKKKDGLNEKLKSSLSEESSKLQNENSKLRKDLDGLRIENAALKKKADSLAATLEELSVTLENVTALKTNNEKLVEKTACQSRALHDLESEKSKAVDSLARLSAEHETCLDTIDRLTDQCDSLQTDQTAAKREKETNLANLRAEHDSCKETIKLLMEKNAALEEEWNAKDNLTDLVPEIDASAGRVKSLCDKYDVIQKEKEDLIKEKTDLANSLCEAESRLTSLLADNEHIGGKIKLLSGQQNEHIATNARLEKEVEAKEKELNAMKGNISDWAADIEKYAQAVKDVERQLGDAKKLLDEKTTELEHQRITHDERLEQLKNQLAELQNCFDEKTSELAREVTASKVECEEMKKQLKDCGQSLCEKTLLLGKERESTGQLGKKLAEAQKSLEEKTLELAGLTKLERQLADSRKCLDEKRRELEIARKLHKTKIESLMALNKTFQGSESPEKLVENYKDQLISAEEELKQSVSDLKEAKRLLSKAVRKVRNETENSDTKSEKESINVILLAQDVSKMLLVEFERAEKLTAELEVLRNAQAESVNMFETCMLDVEKLEAENVEKDKLLVAQTTEMEKLKMENIERETLLGNQKSEMETLKKTLRASQAKLELEQMFLRECRSSLEAEQAVLEETQSKLEAETTMLKECRSKLAKEQTLNKILQKNVDDALKFMNDYKEKYQASEARLAEIRLGSSSDYCTGSDASSGSSPVLDSGENMTQSIRTDDSKALDLTVGRNLIKNTPAVCRSSVDSGIRNSGEFSNADIERKQRAHLVEELNKELTLVQNENHYLEHCLKDLEKEGGECRTRCQELSELNLNLVKEKGALSAKVKELLKRMISDPEAKLCQERSIVAKPSGTRDQGDEAQSNEIDSADPSICKECTNLKQMLKDSEERVSELKVRFQGELAECIGERDELKEKYIECDKVRLHLEKVKSTLEVQAQNVGEHDVIHCRLRLQGEQERTRQLNELLQREHEELEKCRKERDILDAKLKEQTDVEKQLQKDKQMLLMCVKQFQLETANEKTSSGKKKTSVDKRCGALDVQSSVMVEQWLREQVGRHDTSPAKGDVGCSDCHKLQMSLSNLESEKEELVRSLAEMNQAYETLAGLKKENDVTETSPSVAADQDAGKRRTRAAVSLAKRVSKLDAELLSMRVKLDSMTETKRKLEESLAEALQTSTTDRQKVERMEDDLAFMRNKLKSTQADLAVKRNDTVQLQQNLRSEIERSQMLVQSNNKLKTKLENKDYLIEDLALELKGTKSKLTEQTFDYTDTKSALQHKERIVADLTYRLNILCANFSNMNVPRPQDVEDLKLYLKNMDSTPKTGVESSSNMKQLVEDYDSGSDEMEEVRSVRISSPRNIQHVDENLHEKDVAELKKQNRKLVELYNTQEKLIEHLSQEKLRFQEKASKECQEERAKQLETENKTLRDELVAVQEIVGELQEKAQKLGKESIVALDRFSRSEAKSRQNSRGNEKLQELQITLRNLRGQLQVERLAIKSLKDEKNALRETLQKSEHEVDHLRLRFLDLSKSECEQKMEYSLLQGDAKLWTKEKGRFQEVLAVSRNEIKTLEKAVSSLQGTVDDLRKELGAERLGCATLKDEAKAWLSERRQLMMELEMAENEQQKFQGQLEESAKQAKAEEGKVQEFAQQVKALQESELELKRQMQDMEADVKDKSDRILVYEGVLKQVKHFNVTNNLNRQLGIVRNEKQQVLKVLSEKEKEVAMLNLELKQQEVNFKEALDAKENALMSLQSGIAVLTKQLSSCRSKAVGLLQMIQEKETEVRHVTKKFEAQVAEREETIALLEKKIKELEHNFEMLKNEHEIMNISKALDENLVAELRRDFEVMEHKVADLKFQNTELDMKKAELTDKNFEFLTKIGKLEKAVEVKDNIMEACKEQLVLMSNQLDIAYHHKDADGQSPNQEGLAMKQAQLNEREAKLVEKEMLEQKRLDTLNLKEKEVEKLKNALKNRETDLKKREMTVASFGEEVRSNVKDQLNGCLSELQMSRKEETRTKALDESLKARELTVSNKEADLIAREELLNGCHLEIQELAGAVTILECDVGTLKQNLYAKEATLETSKQTCADLETRLTAALDELLIEKQKRKLRSCVKTKSVKTMTDFDVSDAAVTPELETETDTLAKPAVPELEISVAVPEVKEVKSTETQTMRDNFGKHFCHQCGVLLDPKSQEGTSEDSGSKDVSTDKTLSSDCEDCVVQGSSERDGEDPEVLMEAEAYFVMTEPLKDPTVISQELCVANRQPDGSLSISPLKNFTFGNDAAVLQTACEQAVLEEVRLKEKFEELRSGIAELRSEVKDRESCAYKQLDTIEEVEDEMTRIIANLTNEIKALEARLADAVKETPELKAAITALEKYLASERVAHGDMKTKYVNERNLNVWLEKQLQEARIEIDLAKTASVKAEPVLQPAPSHKETLPPPANLLHPASPGTSSVRKRKQKCMKTMGDGAKVARKSPSKGAKPRPKSPARARSPGRVASPRDGTRMKQVTEKQDEMEPVQLFAADVPADDAETTSPNKDQYEEALTVIKTKKDKAKKRMWYPCTICHKTFTDPFFFKNHLRCHERQQFFCTLCDKNFSNKRLYTSHLLMHEKVDLPPAEYRCCVCNIECTSAIELKIHMIKHPALEDSLKPYKCRKCHKAFVLMSGLKAHSRVHKKGRKKFSPKKKRKRSTPTCGTLVLRPLDFETITQHAEVELKNPVVEIENLIVNSQVEELPGVTMNLPAAEDKAEAKVLVRAMGMTKDVLESKGGKKKEPKFERGVTPVELNSVTPAKLNSVTRVGLKSVETVNVDPLESAELVQSEPVPLEPEVTAETEKPIENKKTGPSDGTDKIELKCPHCPKICHMEFTYKRHLLVHSGTKDFVCTICGQAFPLKCNLAVHVKTRHDTPSASPSDIVVKTAKKLAGKAKLKLQIKKLACDQCEEMFKFKKELKKHVREVHKLKSRKKEIKAVTYTCPVCEKKFYLHTKLFCHMETEHLISMDLNTSSVETPVMIPPKCIPSPVEDTGLLSSPVSVKSAASKKQKLFSCLICQKCFRKRKKLNQHMRVHNSQKTLESPQTSVQDSTELAVVSKEILTSQENLDMSFTSQGSSEVTLGSQETLDSSVSSSSSVKKSGRTICLSYCSICGKAFPNRKMLAKHKRKHNLLKRWKKPAVLVLSSSDEKVEEGVSQDPVEVVDIEKNVTDSVRSVEDSAPVGTGKTADETDTVLCDMKSSTDPVETVPSPRDKKKVSDCLKTVSADVGSAFNRLFRAEDNDTSATPAATNIAEAASTLSFPQKAKRLPGEEKKAKTKSTVVRSVFDDKQKLFEADNSVVDNISSAPLDPGTAISAQRVKKSPAVKKKKKRSSKKSCVDPSLLTVVCHICGKRFLQKCNAMSHLKKVHDLVETDIPQDILDGMRREYQCEICLRTFTQKCSLQVHVNRHSETGSVSKVKVLKSKKKMFKKVVRSSIGGEKVKKVKRRSSGNKELLSLLDGPNLEQAALEEKCRSADGMALKRPRKTLKIPEMNNDLYTCHFCGKDYVKFSRLESHISNCGKEKVSKKMKQKFEKFSPKAKLMPSVDQSSSYGLDYDTEAYDDDSSMNTSCIKFSPDDASRKQDCDQFEQLEANLQKLTPDPSPSNRPIRTPNILPAGSNRALNVLPSHSRKRTPSASPAHRKIGKSGSPRKGRSPGRKPKKARLSATPVCGLFPERVEVTSPYFKSTQVEVADSKPVMDDGAPDMFSSTSEDVLPDPTLGEAKIIPKYTPTYSDISDEEDDMPLNRLAKVVTSKEPLKSGQDKSKKASPKDAAALRISPRRRSWDVGQILHDTSIAPSRQISRALTFSNQEQTNIPPESEFDSEPKYESYSKTLKTFERQRHCSDDGRVKRKSRWDQPPAPSVDEKPVLSVYDFIDDDIEMRVPPVKKTELKLSVSGDKTTSSSSHSKPEGSRTKKKISPSGKSSKIHRKKSKHARWSSPKSKKKFPKIDIAPSFHEVNSSSSEPNFALANFSPKRKTDYSSANTYNQCDQGPAFQTSKGGPSFFESPVNVSEKPNPPSTVDPCAAKNTPRSLSSMSTSSASASTCNIHSDSVMLQPNVPLNASSDASMLKDSAAFLLKSDGIMLGHSASRPVNAPQERQLEHNAFAFNSDSSMFRSKPPGHFNDPQNWKDTKVSATHSDSVTFGPNAQKSLSDFPVLNDVAVDLTKTFGSTSTSRAATPPISVPKTESSVSGGRFKCHYCGETFKFHSLYNRHLKKEHKVGRPATDWSL